MQTQDLLTVKKQINSELLNVCDILDDYGINYRISGQNANFQCPFHDDKNPSCGMNINTGLWKCFGCDARGNVITFVANVDDIEYNDAADKIYNKYIKKVPDISTLSGLVDKILVPTQQAVLEDPRFPEWILSRYNNDYTYMYSRGFTDNTLDYFGVVYDPTLQFQGVPVHDDKGKLVGVSGRNVKSNEEPRYKPLIRFRKSNFIFNLHRVDKTKPVIAVEGEINCMKMHQYGYTNTIAFLGAGVTAGQIEIMRNTTIARLIIFFDSDDAGEHGADKLFQGLWQYMFVEKVLDHEGDPDDMTKRQVKQLVESAALYPLKMQ